MPIYYLETNALIELSGEIPRMVHSGVSAYTSALALLELLKGLTPGSYGRKRQILDEVLGTRMTVDWDMPHQRMARAFGVVDPDSKDSDSLRTVCHAMVRCAEFAAFQSELLAKGIPGIPRGVERYAETLSEFHSAAFTDALQRAPDVPAKSRKALYQLMTDALPGVDFSGAGSILDQMDAEATLQIEATLLAIRMGARDVPRAVARLTSRYDHTLDIHFRVSASNLRKRLMLRQTPGRNDLMDTVHFLYLQRPTCRIVSNDRLIHELGARDCPRRAMTVARFREELRQQPRTPGSTQE